MFDDGGFENELRGGGSAPTVPTRPRDGVVWDGGLYIYIISGK